jgi:hypothetical protein
MTSAPLSRANKQAIKDIFVPFLQSEADILGHEDIQDFLRDHPTIVQQQYKLWLASAEVLRLIFNAPIIGHSSFKLDEVTTFAPKYVPTRCHQEASSRLNSAGSIIIIGEPGIGKSTLCATCRATPRGVAKAKNEHQMMPASRKEYIPRAWGSAWTSPTIT